MFALSALRDPAARPLVIVPVQGGHADCLRQARALRHSGADLLEWRLDTDPEWSSQSEQWERRAAEYRQASDLPVLATIRTTVEGGLAEVDDATYLAALKRLVECCEAVDVEGTRGQEVARELTQAKWQAIVVASSHDFAAVPPAEELRATLEHLHRCGDVVKVAVMPACAEDVERLRAAAIEYAARADAKPLIAIAMGELGIDTRLRPRELSSCATFACLERASAPGQVPVADVLAALRSN
ncbi:MAG: type I 3-dehydroquinate dehydratase [Buchananella hordeovulneris]|nr:type I 3-dehydroquinate dehydratase [Buchananella hordeovulneris]